MKTLIVDGWNIGFQKIEFTKALRLAFGYSLTEAKNITDAVLKNQRIELRIDESKADELALHLSELGAKVHIE
jgi:ribosomal protein L7/L12